MSATRDNNVNIEMRIERIGAQIKYIKSVFQHGHISILIHFLVNWMTTLEISDRQNHKVTIQDILKTLTTRIETLQHYYDELVFDCNSISSETVSLLSTAASTSSSAVRTSSAASTSGTSSAAPIASSLTSSKTSTALTSSLTLIEKFRQNVYTLFNITPLLTSHIALGSQLSRLSVVTTLINTWTQQLVDTVLFTDTESEFEQRLYDCITERYSSIKFDDGTPNAQLIHNSKHMLAKRLLKRIESE